MPFLKSSPNLRILGERIDPPFERDCMCVKLKQHEEHMVRLTGENEDQLCRYTSKKGLKIEWIDIKAAPLRDPQEHELGPSWGSQLGQT